MSTMYRQSSDNHNNPEVQVKLEEGASPIPNELTSAEIMIMMKKAPHKYIQLLTLNMNMCTRLSRDYNSMACLYNQELKQFKAEFGYEKYEADTDVVASHLIFKEQERQKEKQKTEEEDTPVFEQMTSKNPWLSPFFYYLQKNRDKIVKQNGTTNGYEIFKTAAKTWKSFTPFQKEVYRRRALYKAEKYIGDAMNIKLQQKKTKLRTHIFRNESIINLPGGGAQPLSSDKVKEAV